MKIGDLVRIKPHLTENRQWLVGLVVGLQTGSFGEIVQVHWINDSMREDEKYKDDLEIINE